MEPIRKITHGWVTQEFDPETGKCLWQNFYAGDLVEWEDSYGNEITPTEEIIKKCYHNFEMSEPTSVGLKGFKCPKCGSNRVEEVMPGITQASEIIDVFIEDGNLICEYGAASYSGGDPSDIYYQCLECGEGISEEILKKIAEENYE